MKGPSEKRKPADEIMTRKVRVLDPMDGEITVEINITQIMKQIAGVAYRNAHGVTNAQVHVEAFAKCSGDTLATRAAYLALNQEKREKLAPKLELLPP